MAKTNFVNGNPAQGVQGTVVTAEFLNAFNNHRHRGLAQDGDGAIDYAPDTGAANAYVIALTPALTAHVVGMPIHFKAANANTGASSVVVNALASVPIKKNVNENLAANDIKAGKIVSVVWDGVDYQMLSQTKSEGISPVRDTFRNLVIKNHAVNPNYQLSITADEVMLSDGASSQLISALTETLDITVAGVNGLDTGAEAASTWYHIWAIAKADGTKKTLASLSATAPTMPSGYTFKAYLGAVFNKSSSDFISMRQKNRRVYRENIKVLSSGTAATWESVSLANAIPITADSISGYNEAGLGLHLGIHLSPEGSDVGMSFFIGISTGQHLIGFPFSDLPLATSQVIFYKLYALWGASQPASINVNGWGY